MASNKQPKKNSIANLAKSMKKGMGGNKPPVEFCKLTAQDSVPIFAVHEKENLIETYPGFYTRTYRITENNYQTDVEDAQQQTFVGLRSVFNSLGVNCEISFSVFNRNINLDEFKDLALKKETGDELDYLRRELNEIIVSRIKEGRNGLIKNKYVTVGLHTDSLKKAHETFSGRLQNEIKAAFLKVQSDLTMLSIEQRLEIIHDMYNIHSQGEFLTKTRVVDFETGETTEVSSFNLEDVRSMGLTVADVVSPSSIRIFPKYMQFGKTYVCAMRIDSYPSSLSDTFFVKLTDVNFNMISTMNINPIPTQEANKIVNRNIKLARNEKIEERSNLLKNNLPEDMISMDTEEKLEKAEAMRTEMQENDEKLFKTCHTVVFWADSKEKLREYTESIRSICQAEVVGIHVMEDMQEEGFNATLPLLYNCIPYKMKRTLKSTSLTCATMPFAAMELSDPGGINYSVNLASKNLILYDRLKTQNFNGFILGTPGCVDAGTEYFNGKEWKRIADYSENEQVLQFSTKTNEASLVIPNKYIKKPCEKMYHFETEELDQTLSAEHRVIYYNENNVAKEMPAIDFVNICRRGVFRGKFRISYEKEEYAYVPKGMVIEEVVPSDGYKYCFTVPTHNLVLRRNGKVFITGNSGKSFTAKVEMLNVVLGSNAQCIVVDPESEYGALAKLIGGEVIKIVPGGKWHINPLEISPNYEFDDESTTDPILAKADFVLKLFEVIIKSPFGLNSIQEVIIDECFHELYAPFVKGGKLQDIPKEKMPTLTDLQVKLAQRPEPEARELAIALKMYTGTGSLNVFGFQSNVDTKNRFVVYDIKDVGDKLKPLAMLIILDSIQNTLFENRKRGKNTWFWVDECHLLFLDESTASTLATIWKRARKYGGVPTGITQNVEDLLKSATCKTLLSNCNFIQILNQAALDRENLRSLLNLSDAQVDVITSAPKGQGLIYTGSNCVGFHSVFPKNNSIYRCLTSNMKEIKEYEKAEKRAKTK